MTSILKTDEIQSQNGGAVVKMQTLKHPSSSGNNLELASDGSTTITNGTLSAGTLNSSVTGNWGWKLLQTVSGNNNTSELDVGSTDGGSSTLLTSTYSLYKFIISDLACAGAGRDLFIRFYKGSGLKTNEYDYSLEYISSSTGGILRSNNAGSIRTNGDGIQQYDGNANPTRFGGLNGEINLFDPSLNQWHFINGIVSYHGSANYQEHVRFAGGNSRHQSHNGSGNGYDPLKFLRFYWSGGNIYRGTIRLYGVINA